jgi:hypothetical protein
MYSVGGKIISVGNKFPESRVNTLTFVVSSTQFPESTIGFQNFRGSVSFDSSGPNSVLVNWGDGEFENFNFGSDVTSAPFRIGWRSDGQALGGLPGDTFAGRHIYSDNNSGLRVVTFTFRDLSLITNIDFVYSALYGLFPSEVGAAVNLKEITLLRTNFLGALPESLIKNKNIEEFFIQSTFLTIKEKIPDGIFNNSIIDFVGTGSFNLSDPISSNFFKINNLKNTIVYLNLGSCSIITLPQSLSQCTLLGRLELAGNPIKNPEVIEPLFNLYILSITVGYFENGLFNTTNLTKLRFLRITNMTESLILEIPLKWTGLKALSNFVRFQDVVVTNIIFQAFIENFYTLCTENGFLDPSSTEAQNTGFPEQFRDISWGEGNDRFTVSDPIQAPSGFSLGISNGIPANNAEKIYVLVENYGHTVELAP